MVYALYGITNEIEDELENELIIGKIFTRVATFSTYKKAEEYAEQSKTKDYEANKWTWRRRECFIGESLLRPFNDYEIRDEQKRVPHNPKLPREIK